MFGKEGEDPIKKEIAESMCSSRLNTLGKEHTDHIPSIIELAP
jgi:hypothetical protein